MHLELSRRDVYELMIKLGYRWGKGVKRGGRILESDQKQADTFRFALEWSEALQMEESGSHVLVYMDESFCNTGHTHRHSWFLCEHSLVEFGTNGNYTQSTTNVCFTEALELSLTKIK